MWQELQPEVNTQSPYGRTHEHLIRGECSYTKNLKEENVHTPEKTEGGECSYTKNLKEENIET